MCIRTRETYRRLFLLAYEERGWTATQVTHPRGCQVGADSKKKTYKKDTHHSKHPLFCRSIVYKRVIVAQNLMNCGLLFYVLITKKTLKL